MEKWPAPLESYSGADLKRLRAARRAVNRVRNFPHNTCPASRHLHMIADALASQDPYWLLLEEPQHCAETMYAVLEALWKLRTAVRDTKKERKDASARVRRSRLP